METGHHIIVFAQGPHVDALRCTISFDHSNWQAARTMTWLLNAINKLRNTKQLGGTVCPASDTSCSTWIKACVPCSSNCFMSRSVSTSKAAATLFGTSIVGDALGENKLLSPWDCDADSADCPATAVGCTPVNGHVAVAIERTKCALGDGPSGTTLIDAQLQRKSDRIASKLDRNKRVTARLVIVAVSLL
jgi:hypothetical protein